MHCFQGACEAFEQMLEKCVPDNGKNARRDSRFTGECLRSKLAPRHVAPCGVAR